jgi:hypothetical protein
MASRRPPGPWPNTGSDRSRAGMLTFSPLSMSVMLRPFMASVTAFLI